MTNRLATRIGLPSAEDRPAGAHDVTRFHEPAAGALSRTKGTLFLLAQVTGDDVALGRAATETLDAIERDYYYDLSAGVLLALSRALGAANRRIYHQRRRLGIPQRGGLSVIGLVVRGREGHVARLGAASAVVVRGGRMYELPPPADAPDDDPRVRRRVVAATLGEAPDVEPLTWQGQLAAGDALALVSRNLARTVGVAELKAALAEFRPTAAVAHLLTMFAERGGSGSDGVLAVEITALADGAAVRRLEPVRPAEPFAGLPDQSPVPLADAIGRGLHRARDAAEAARAGAGRALHGSLSRVVGFVPRRGPRYPRSIPRTAEREHGRRRRLGLVAMAPVAGLMAVGITVASLPAARPADAIRSAAIARQAIAAASALVGEVEARVEGATLVDRDPPRAADLLAQAQAAVGVAVGAGVPEPRLAGLQSRAERHLDMLHRAARLDEVSLVVDLGALFDDLDPAEMVAASDGTLWVRDAGRGRVMRVDPGDGSAAVIYRAGQPLPDGEVPGDPWLMATAATDVVVVDRERRAWRIDLDERIPRPMVLAGTDAVSAESRLLGALQHRPPLEIFNLYLVDGASGELRKWSPPPVIPVDYPAPPGPFLSDAPDLDPRHARALRVDANVWFLHATTVTRVDFGVPRAQADYSLDTPPDAAVRPRLDYTLFDGAALGDRDYLYVYDAANARIIAFQRADGAFVRQWLAPSSGATASVLDGLRGLSVSSAADGPAVAHLLAGDRLLRLVLE